MKDEELDKKLNDNVYQFQKDTIKFNLKDFLKLLDKKFSSKKHIKSIQHTAFNEDPDIFIDVLKSSTKDKTEYTKLLNKVKNYLYMEVENWLYEDGALLPLVSNNFKFEKEYRIKEEDDEYYVNHSLQIISSKINKTFYILASHHNVFAGIKGVHCLKKFKDKKKAIVFIKKEIQKIKNSNKERIKRNKYYERLNKE